jgi:small-conductance mechanosensitive channel
VVEDVKLTYTYIRLDDGRRLIVPNERLAQSSVLNHTILDPRVQVEVSVWLPADADLDKAMEVIRDEQDGVEVSVAEVDKEAVRLTATTWAASPSQRGKTAAELRRRWLRLLREHALSSTEA